jgi:AcrR family transcriptional regulator
VVRMAAKERREELIEAAIRVMVRDGVAKATTRAIVAEADMSLGVFHYCFTSREEMLNEVATRITDRAGAASRQAFARARDLRTGIVEGLQAFWKGVEANPGEHLVSYELTQYALRQEGMGELARRQYAHYLEVHAELLEEAAAAANVEWTVPVPTLARYMNSMLDGLTFCWVVDRDSDSSQDVLELMSDYLVSLSRKRKPVRR